MWKVIIYSLSGSNNLLMTTCLSLRISFIPLQKRRRGEAETQEKAPGAETQFFSMGVKCPGCYKITTIFSHAQTVVSCVGCFIVLCQEEKQGWQKAAPSDRSSTKSTLNQEEWGNIPINTFWIKSNNIEYNNSYNLCNSYKNNENITINRRKDEKYIWLIHEKERRIKRIWNRVK